MSCLKNRRMNLHPVLRSQYQTQVHLPVLAVPATAPRPAAHRHAHQTLTSNNSLICLRCVRAPRPVITVTMNEAAAPLSSFGVA
jgi:hypothetical protein